MKQKLITIMLGCLLALGSIPLVSATSSSQVDLSDVGNEESFRAALAEFVALERVESQVTIQNATQESLVTMVYDQAVLGMKHQTQIPEGELTSEMLLVVYLYDNGIEVSDMVQLLESTVAWTSKYDPNFEARVQEVAAAAEGRLVMSETSDAFTGFHLQGYQFFLNPECEFSDFLVEANGLVTAEVDLTDYLTANEDSLTTHYPEGSQFHLVIRIDQVAQTLTSTMTIDIDEAKQEELYGNLVYTTLQSAMTDTVIQATHQATDERVPALEELETMTLEEYEAITAVLQQ